MAPQSTVTGVPVNVRCPQCRNEFRPNRDLDCKPTSLLYVFLLIIAITVLVLFVFTAIHLSQNLPTVPTVSVGASTSPNITLLTSTTALVPRLDLAISVSNHEYSHALSFRDVELSTPSGPAALPHPNFEVSPKGSALLWFRFHNVTLLMDSFGVPAMSIELEAKGRPHAGWPASSKEVMVRAKCCSLKVSFSLIDQYGIGSVASKAEAWPECATDAVWKSEYTKFLNGSTVCFFVLFFVCAGLLSRYKGWERRRSDTSQQSLSL